MSDDDGQSHFNHELMNIDLFNTRNYSRPRERILDDLHAFILMNSKKYFIKE